MIRRLEEQYEMDSDDDLLEVGMCMQQVEEENLAASILKQPEGDRTETRRAYLQKEYLR